MTQSKQSVFEYYTRAMADPHKGEEGLSDSVDAAFLLNLGLLSRANGGQALDLGYGLGSYTVAMVRAGFDVHAIDFISPEALITRITSEKLPPHKVRISQLDIEQFIPTHPYDAVVARHVLHFCSRDTIERVLRTLTLSATETRSCLHYITMFTDIHRLSSTGQPIEIEGESRYTKEEWETTIEALYRDWKEDRRWSVRTQTEPKSGSVYFSANCCVSTLWHGIPMPEACGDQ